MKIIDPKETVFSRTASGLISLSQGDGTTIAPVHCVRLFPLTDPDHYISVLRSEKSDDPEIGVLRDLKEIPEEQRALILTDLAQRHFLPEILDVTKILMSNGMDEWHVSTDRGDKVFLISSRKDSITVTDDNMLILTDVEKCRYRIQNYMKLPPQAFNLVARALP